MSNALQHLCDGARLVADVLAPQECFICGDTSVSAPVCAHCSAELPVHPTEACPLCAIPTPGGTPCGQCLCEPPAFDATRCLFSYQFPVDRMVQAFKYHCRLSMAQYFTRALVTLGPPAGIDLVLPMPLHVARLRERGFNQAVELARPLARKWGLPLELARVGRTVHGAPQVSLPWQERVANMRDVFCCAGMMTGKAVLVVDDVMTTGATLDSLARTLKHHGAARVENLVVARTLAA